MAAASSSRRAISCEAERGGSEMDGWEQGGNRGRKAMRRRGFGACGRNAQSRPRPFLKARAAGVARGSQAGHALRTPLPRAWRRATARSRSRADGMPLHIAPSQLPAAVQRYTPLTLRARAITPMRTARGEHSPQVRAHNNSRAWAAPARHG